MARQVVNFPSCVFFHIFQVIRVIPGLTGRTANVFVDSLIQTLWEGHAKYLKLQLGFVSVT